MRRDEKTTPCFAAWLCTSGIPANVHLYLSRPSYVNYSNQVTDYNYKKLTSMIDV